jgi:hypothetical protein
MVFLCGVVLIILGIVYRKNPNIYRRGIWLKTSVRIRTMSPEAYEAYMRKQGSIAIGIGCFLVLIRVLEVLSSN